MSRHVGHRGLLVGLVTLGVLGACTGAAPIKPGDGGAGKGDASTTGGGGGTAGGSGGTGNSGLAGGGAGATGADAGGGAGVGGAGTGPDGGAAGTSPDAGTGSAGSGGAGGGVVPGGLVVQVMGSPSPIAGGDVIVYRIDLSNTSTNTPTGNITMTATIPQYAVIKDYPANVTCGTCRFGSLLNWPVASLAPGDRAVMYISATVDNSTAYPPPAAGALLTTNITAKAGNTTINKAASIVVGARGLSVALDARPDRVAPSGVLSYTVTFGNPGSAGVAALLHVALPPGTTFQAATAGGALVGRAVEWNLGTLAPGFSDTRQFSVTVDAGTATGALLLADAELRDPTNQQILVHDAMDNLVTAKNFLSMVMSAAPDPVAAGDIVEYTIVLSNLSPNTPTGPFTIQATIPEHAKVLNYPANFACGTCRLGTFLGWPVESLSPGESVVQHITIAVDNSVTLPPPPAGTVLSSELTASVFGTVSARANLVVGQGPRLDLKVNATPNRVAPGAALTYTVHYGNAGKPAFAAALRVPVPTGTTFVSATGGGTASGGVVQWDLGNLAPGVADSRQFSVTVDPAAANGALVVANADLRRSDTQQSLSRAATTNLVASTTYLSLTITAAPTPAVAGATIQYTMTFTNLSTNTATGQFVAVATIPEHTKVMDYPANFACGTCRYGVDLAWPITSLAPGGTTTQYITVVVDNTIALPPPPPGSLLALDVVAAVFGGTRTTVVVPVK